MIESHHVDCGAVVDLRGGSVEVGLCVVDHLMLVGRGRGRGRVLAFVGPPVGPRSPIGPQLIIEAEDVLGANVLRQLSQYTNRVEICFNQVVCAIEGGGIEYRPSLAHSWRVSYLIVIDNLTAVYEDN